jgi:hypothetical protein
VTGRGKSLKVLLVRRPFGARHFSVCLNGERWPDWNFKQAKAEAHGKQKDLL